MFGNGGKKKKEKMVENGIHLNIVDQYFQRHT